MIDTQARERLLEEKRMKDLKDFYLRITGRPQGGGDGQPAGSFDRVAGYLENIFTAVKNIKVSFPDIYKVTGRVNVERIESLPPVQVKNLAEVQSSIAILGSQIADLQKATIKAMQAIEMVVPKNLSINNEVKIRNFADLLEGIEELKKGFNLLINKESATVAFPSSAVPVEIQNWMVPQPVTNINVNALQGAFLSTDITVRTTATQLPTSNLANRRSLIVYNNSSSTIYLGGSGVTASGSTKGFPLLTGSYSPPFDAGQNMNLYGIVASGTADCQVLEMSTEASGR